MASKIIIVDDEVRFLESQKVLLESDGFKVEIASSGPAAISMFQIQKFDLYIFDINMPEMDGFQLMKEVFKIDPDAFIIMMTGDVSVDSAVRSMKLGAYDYLKKPFEYEDLLKTIKNALEKKQLIIENKAYSYRLQLTEKFYQSVVHHSPDLIYVLGPAGRFTFANKAFERILGYKREEVIGKSYKMLLFQEDFIKSELFFNERRTGERAAASVEMKLKRSDLYLKNNPSEASYLFVELKATGVYDRAITEKGKKFLGTYGVARDMTYRKQLEYQLMQAQKMDAIGTLAGGIAHDFNNILMGIQGYSSLLLIGLTPDDSKYSKLVSIDQYVRNGAELTRQLLDFASDANYNVRPANLNTMLRKSISMFGRTKKEISIHSSFQKGLWPAEVDEGQISQVILNLYVNAWQAMPNGGELYVKSENVSLMRIEAEELGLNGGNYVRITVRDTGIGMDENTRQRIFEPFFTTKKKVSGTGLGLSSAYGIIKSHGGCISVLSTKGKGSIFYIYLPSTEKRVVYEIRPPARPVIGKGTVLIIDDEENIINVTREMLESMGYTVMTAKSGNEGIDVFRRNSERIDVLILDMIMPGMSGGETMEHIKNIDPNARILLSSGYGREGAAEEIMARGCDGFIQKPYDLEKLSRKIYMLCRDRN
ncbi:MAG: response regulator [Proteobacteria bacterium]|nr:response regulator [Pseudomonadota bacterium]